MRKVIVAAIVLVGWIHIAPISAEAQSQAIEEDSLHAYESFMALPLQKRITVFNEMSPESRARIVKTQSSRWLEVNRKRLDTAQISVIQNFINFITPELYSQPRSDYNTQRIESLTQIASAVLPRSDLAQALTIRGSYIPLPE